MGAFLVVDDDAVETVDDAGKIAEEAEEDVDDEVGGAAGKDEDAYWRA